MGFETGFTLLGMLLTSDELSDHTAFHANRPTPSHQLHHQLLQLPTIIRRNSYTLLHPYPRQVAHRTHHQPQTSHISPENKFKRSHPSRAFLRHPLHRKFSGTLRILSELRANLDQKSSTYSADADALLSLKKSSTYSADAEVAKDFCKGDRHPK